jgi:hydroxymethylbilane synthase
VSERLHIRIGTRGSKLALAQAGAVAAMLERLGATTETTVIRTAGDAGAEPLSESPTGVFVTEIEKALLDHAIDLAVHSMKDLPTEVRAGLTVAAVPERVDPRDALVTQTGVGLAALPSGSRVATSSPRRAAQIRASRPDLAIVAVRGNVDTRLRKLQEGQFEALLLAHAGLLRLGLQDRATEVLSPDVCLPAPGQGALALQMHENGSRIRDLVARLDHTGSRLAVTAERSFLSRLGAGCALPAGALGSVEGSRLRLQAIVAHPNGSRVMRREVTGEAENAEALGRDVADGMLRDGAGVLIEES